MFCFILVTPTTGSSKDAQRDVRRSVSHKVCRETDVAAEDDEEAEGRRTQSAHFLSGESTHKNTLNIFQSDDPSL